MATRGELGTVPGLRRRCALYRAELADGGLASAEVLRDYWPGGRQNADHGLAGWIVCYGKYLVLLCGGSLAETPPPPADAESEHAALQILRGAPIVVEMEARDAQGTPHTRQVFPKSQHALVMLELYEGDLGRLAVAYEALKQGPSTVFAAAAGDVLHGISHCQRMFAWIVCHDGTGLPYPDLDLNPLPPAWTAELSPVDHLMLVQAHRQLAARLGLALRLIEPAKGAGQRPGSWSTLLAVASTELGVSSRTLTRDHTLEAVVLQLSMARNAQRAPASAEDES